jgi:tetratricopeptide (TPR) repeat protein
MPKSTPVKATAKKEPVISKSSPPKVVDHQLNAFEKAMKLFHKRSFDGALPLFEEAAKGADVAMSQAARMHIRMCEQRLVKTTPKLTSAEDYCAYGVSLISRRELDTAEQQLKKALQLAPRADYVLYSMALAKGLQGDIAAAASFLAKAIEIQPGNKSAARNDPDFRELLDHAAIRGLVY